MPTVVASLRFSQGWRCFSELLFPARLVVILMSYPHAFLLIPALAGSYLMGIYFLLTLAQRWAKSWE